MTMFLQVPRLRSMKVATTRYTALGSQDLLKPRLWLSVAPRGLDTVWAVDVGDFGDVGALIKSLAVFEVAVEEETLVRGLQEWREW